MDNHCSDELVCIASFNTPNEADIFRAILEEHGVATAVDNDNLVAMAWHLGGAVGGVRVSVFRQDVEKAIEIFPGLTQPNFSLSLVGSQKETGKKASQESTCACGEPFLEGFDVCWSCGLAPGEAPPEISESLSGETSPESNGDQLPSIQSGSKKSAILMSISLVGLCVSLGGLVRIVLGGPSTKDESSVVGVMLFFTGVWLVGCVVSLFLRDTNSSFPEEDIDGEEDKEEELPDELSRFVATEETVARYSPDTTKSASAATAKKDSRLVNILLLAVLPCCIVFCLYAWLPDDMYVRFHISRDFRVSLPSFLILVPIWFALVYFTVSAKVNSFQRESAEDNQTDIQAAKNTVRRASVAFLFGSVFCLPPIGVLAAWYILYRGGVSLDSPDPMVRRWVRAMVWLGIIVLAVTAILALALWMMSSQSSIPGNSPIHIVR